MPTSAEIMKLHDEVAAMIQDILDSPTVAWTPAVILTFQQLDAAKKALYSAGA